jgi:hypothetical protein
VASTLVRTQKFSEKGKAPPPLIENRELGLFFMDGQLTVRSTEQWRLRRGSIAGYSDSAKANSGLFCHLYSVEIDAVADEWDLYLMSICDNIKMTNDHNKKLVTSTSLIAIERDTIR